MRFITCLAVLFGSLTANAQTVKMPESIKLDKGRLGAVRIEYDGDDVRWFVSPELDIFREYSTDPKDVRLRVQGFADGKFQVMAVTCKNGKLSDLYVCWVFLGAQPSPTPTPLPTPPGPVPVPVPVPPGPVPVPVPPSPTPPVPTPPAPTPLPSDPVAGRLADAFRLVPGPVPDKVKSCQALSAFYGEMAKHIRANEIRDNGVVYSVNTVSELLSDYSVAGRGLFKPDEVVAVRKQLSVEVSTAVGPDGGRVIDPTLRDALAKLFELLAAVLKLLS